MFLPKDPNMLLSVINTRLRDFYPSLSALCDEEDADREEIEKTLSSIGRHYDANSNQFV